MKPLVLAVLLALPLTGTAFAETKLSSDAAADANAGASATINMGGQAVYLDQRGHASTRAEVVNSGKYTVRSAPSVQAPSMGSGHPCGVGSSIGLSIIGGGATGGATKVDDACLILQAGATQAGLLMVAERNSSACVALRSAGNIPSNSVCTKAEKAAMGKGTRPAARPTAVNAIPTCPTGSRWDGKGCWMPKKKR